MHPSLLISEATGELLKINNSTYQLRQFIFEASPENNELDFSHFIEKYDQLSEPPKPAPGVLYPTDYFSATPQMKKDGYFYLLSLRKIDCKE